jgi:hypothetical protein
MEAIAYGTCGAWATFMRYQVLLKNAESKRCELYF